MRRSRRGRLEVRHVPWLLAVPAIVLAVALRYLPSLFGAGYAFTDWTGLTLSADPIGFENFTTIFTDETARGSLLHTLLLAALVVLFSNVIGLALALVLQQRFKTRNLLRALFFLPFALSYLATGYIWQYIFSYTGPLNQFLGIRRARRLAATLARRPALGHLHDRHRHDLAVHRADDGDLPGRAGGNPGGAG